MPGPYGVEAKVTRKAAAILSHLLHHLFFWYPATVTEKRPPAHSKFRWNWSELFDGQRHVVDTLAHEWEGTTSTLRSAAYREAERRGLRVSVKKVSTNQLAIQAWNDSREPEPVEAKTPRPQAPVPVMKSQNPWAPAPPQPPPPPPPPLPLDPKIEALLATRPKPLQPQPLQPGFPQPGTFQPPTEEELEALDAQMRADCTCHTFPKCQHWCIVAGGKGYPEPPVKRDPSELAALQQPAPATDDWDPSLFRHEDASTHPPRGHAAWATLPPPPMALKPSTWGPASEWMTEPDLDGDLDADDPDHGDRDPAPSGQDHGQDSSAARS